VALSTGAKTSGGWETAIRVPGSAELGGISEATSLSCGAPGNCSAGGWYSNHSGTEGFVVNELQGVWQKAEEVPGLARLNVGRFAELSTISCSSAGNCAAGGFYAGSFEEAFVVDERDGTWGRAKEVPGLAQLNTGSSLVSSVSCGANGDCSVGGVYYDGLGNQAFVASESDGVWGRAEEVPGTARLNTERNGDTLSVSCVSKGNCSAGGRVAALRGLQAFVVTETNGQWKPAELVRGIASRGKSAEVNSISCALPGDCSAAGIYAETTRRSQAFVVNETDGVWGRAEEVPGTARLNSGDNAAITSVSCPSAGDCTAGGYYTMKPRAKRALVVNEIDGKWESARVVAGMPNRDSEIESVSCGSNRFCSGGGAYFGGGSWHSGPFVLNRTRGRWRKAREVPGTAVLNKGNVGETYALSCASARHCSAVGFFSSSSTGGGASYASKAFVVSRV
jgi:hypothetical protein